MSHDAASSSCSLVFFKTSVLKSLANFTGKHLCWSLFFKKRVQHMCFPVKFANQRQRIPHYNINTKISCNTKIWGPCDFRVLMARIWLILIFSNSGLVSVLQQIISGKVYKIIWNLIGRKDFGALAQELDFPEKSGFQRK